MNSPEIKTGEEVGLRLKKIGDHLKKWLLSGELVFDQTEGYEFAQSGDGYRVLLMPMDAILEKHRQNPGLKEQGSCRFLLPALEGKLKQMGLIDSASYFVDDGIHHFALVARVKTGEDEHVILIDLARRRPVPEPVLLNGGPVRSDFYHDLDSVTYEAVGNDHQVDFRIIEVKGGRKKYKNISYRPLKGEGDELHSVRAGLAYHSEFTRAAFESGRFERVDRVGTINGQTRLKIKKALEEGTPPVEIVMKRSCL